MRERLIGQRGELDRLQRLLEQCRRENARLRLVVDQVTVYVASGQDADGTLAAALKVLDRRATNST